MSSACFSESTFFFIGSIFFFFSVSNTFLGSNLPAPGFLCPAPFSLLPGLLFSLMKIHHITPFLVFPFRLKPILESIDSVHLYINLPVLFIEPIKYSLIIILYFLYGVIIPMPSLDPCRGFSIVYSFPMNSTSFVLEILVSELYKIRYIYVNILMD